MLFFSIKSNYAFFSLIITALNWHKVHTRFFELDLHHVWKLSKARACIPRNEILPDVNASKNLAVCAKWIDRSVPDNNPIICIATLARVVHHTSEVSRNRPQGCHIGTYTGQFVSSCVPFGRISALSASRLFPAYYANNMCGSSGSVWNNSYCCFFCFVLSVALSWPTRSAVINLIFNVRRLSVRK